MRFKPRTFFVSPCTSSTSRRWSAFARLPARAGIFVSAGLCRAISASWRARASSSDDKPETTAGLGTSWSFLWLMALTREHKFRRGWPEKTTTKPLWEMLRQLLTCRDHLLGVMSGDLGWICLSDTLRKLLSGVPLSSGSGSDNTASQEMPCSCSRGPNQI